MKLRIATILSVISLAIATGAHAEVSTVVSGRVLDQTGAALPGVAIDLRLLFEQ